MFRTIEAILEKDGTLLLLEQVDLSGAQHVLVTLLDENAATFQGETSATALLSEMSLREDWNKSEEDEAWQHFQSSQVPEK